MFFLAERFEKMKKLLLIALAVSACTLSFADEEETAKLNGDFLGKCFWSIPGWQSEGDGDISVIDGRKEGHKQLKIEAPEQGVQSAVSDFLAVSGKVLCVEAEANGSGKVQIGALVSDAQKAVLAETAEARTVRTGHGRTDRKYYFKMPENAAYVQIVLSASDGAVATFGNVETSFTNELTPEILAALKPEVPEAAPAPVAEEAAPVVFVSIADGETIAAEKLTGDEKYQITIPLNAFFDFSIEEKSGENLLWQVVSFDKEACRIKLTHDNVGLWPFDTDVAQISVKAKIPGVSDLVLQYGEQKVTLRVNIL